MPSTSSRSRPKSTSRLYRSLDTFPAVPADKFAGARRQEHCSPPQKMKRLKSRKERNQIRGPYISSFFRSHVKRVCKDKAQGCSCQKSYDSHSHNYARKEKAIAKPFLPLRPTIITEGRLTSITGLFSKEVRSVDIERLMTDRRKSHSQSEDHQGQAAAASIPSPSLFSPRLDSGEPDASISRCVQDCDRELTSEQTDHLQTCHKGLENIIGSVSRSKTPGTRPAVLSSAESDFIQSVSTPDPAHKTGSRVLQGEQEEEQLGKTTAALDKQQTSHNPPVRSLQSEPAVCCASPPAPADKAQQTEPGVLITSEAVSRLAARLGKNLHGPSLWCRCPLLTECRGVLLQTLQERNSLAGRHLLFTTPKEPSDPAPHVREQASTSSEQKYGESTPMYFSFTRAYEGGLQSNNNSSCRENFYQDTERGAANVRRRSQAWTLCSPQDFLTKLQSPCEDIDLRCWKLTDKSSALCKSPKAQLRQPDMLDQWSVRMPVPEFLTGNPNHSSLHQTFLGTETSAPYSNSCGPESTEHSVFLKPQSQAKLSISQNTVREINDLLDQWSSDPDLAFLSRDNLRRSHTSSALLTELNALSSYRQEESARVRPPFEALSTVSAVLPPEGFSYDPYYRFPHSVNCISRPERPSTSRYNLSDIIDLGLSPSLLLNTPYFRNSL